MNLNSFSQEALTHLQNLIRINTTNPPGNEVHAINYVAAVLKEADIPYQIFEPSPGRASLVARLKGDGSGRPLLLTSHVDVVPAETKSWKYDPFCGDIHEECVWGRGAVDMKQMTAMELAIFVAIKKQNITLKRDIILVAVADEEAGCQWGSKWLVANHPELLDAEYALNEVGGFSLYMPGVKNKIFYPIGVAERGMLWFKIIMEGKPGHGSLPHNQQAVVKLARAAHCLGTHDLPLHIHPLVREFIEKLAHEQSFFKKIIFKLLLSPFFNRFILNKLIPAKKVPGLKSLFANTVAPTIFTAGSKVNVIPSRAELSIDGRILPGQTFEKLLKEVEKVVHAEYEIEILAQQEPVAMEYNNDFYKILCDSLIQNDEQAIPVPYLIPGFTDAGNYSKLGIKCYGFTPVKLDPGMDFAELFHGHNERIPVEGFFFGLKVLWDVINKWCL